MSEFIVSARKYRPTRFSDVVGQEHVSETLKNALRQEKIAHAFLFCGPRGVGKTTNARILAKILNCINRTSDFEACGKCASCVSFESNSSFVIFELDAASNSSVENIRGLIEQVRIPPQSGKYKVFIIDEVHMLSQSAFNAFLKTLEEPPPYAIFILATTEKHKILPTILSRCQVFDFKRITNAAIVAHLMKICALEIIDADEAALHVVASKSDGSLRDALSIFDRLVSASKNNKLELAHVVQNLNVLDFDYFFKLTQEAAASNESEVLIIFDEIQHNGFEGDIFIQGFAEHLRQLLVSKNPKTLHLIEQSESVKQRYTEQASLLPTSFILTALDVLNTCDINYKMARSKRLHVELALLKIAHISNYTQFVPQTSEKKNTDKQQITPVQKQNQKSVTAVSTPQNNIKVETKHKDNLGTTLAPKDYEPKPESARVSEMKTNYSVAPKIGNLESIALDIAASEALLSEAVSRLSFDNLKESWTKYTETHERPSVKSVLKTAVLALEGNRVNVTVGSTMSKNFIIQEQNLPDFLRFDLNEPNLSLQISIDETLNPDSQNEVIVKRYLNAREKIKLMMEVNPLVSALAKRLDLKPDE